MKKRHEDARQGGETHEQPHGPTLLCCGACSGLAVVLYVSIYSLCDSSENQPCSKKNFLFRCENIHNKSIRLGKNTSGV